MPKYLLHGRYNAAMVEALHTNGATSRLDAIATGMARVGGSVDCCYWTNSGTENWVIADLPDDAAANAIVLSVSRHSTDGAWATVTRLLDATDLDTAIARNSSMRPPGTD